MFGLLVVLFVGFVVFGNFVDVVFVVDLFELCVFVFGMLVCWLVDEGVSVVEGDLVVVFDVMKMEMIVIVYCVGILL